MNIGVGRVGLWPLRAVGLDPGRALINAHPRETQKNRDRFEMRAYIFEAIPVRRHDGESPIAPRDRGPTHRTAQVMTCQLVYPDYRMDPS